jgi:hypothetical protein
MEIKNLAQFKKEMKVGTKWFFTDSRYPESALRTCTNATSKSFAFDNSPRAFDKTLPHWLDYPKASDISFEQICETTIVSIKVGNAVMKYRKIQGE